MHDARCLSIVYYSPDRLQRGQEYLNANNIVAVARRAPEEEMTTNLEKKTANLGVAWEGIYGYSQAVKVKDTIYISGQLSHDGDGNLIAPALLDAASKPRDFDNMAGQMRQTYRNAIELLAQFGATLDNVVEETLFVLDVDAAFKVAGEVRKELYGAAQPAVASNLIGVSRLAFPEQLIEITFRAIV